jgi:hypothetical protein
MSDPSTPDPDETTLARELRGLRAEVRELNNHRYLRIQNSIPKMMGFSFLRGLAVGLGTVIGASVLVSVLGFFLAQIDFIPIVGEWASQLAEQIAREVGQGGFTGADRPGPPDTGGTAPDN